MCEGILVNDELLDLHDVCWQVTHVRDNGVVVATPIYHPLHRRYWVRFSYLEATVMKNDKLAYDAAMEAEAAAEMRAETNIPQHLVW